MAKVMDDGELFLSPQEASSMLNVSYKTLQRWADKGERHIWVSANGNGHRIKQRQAVELKVRLTHAGHRMYSASSIRELCQSLATANGTG